MIEDRVVIMTGARKKKRRGGGRGTNTGKAYVVVDKRIEDRAVIRIGAGKKRGEQIHVTSNSIDI